MSVSLRLSWSKELVPGQLELHEDTLSQKNKRKQKTIKKGHSLKKYIFVCMREKE